MKKKTLIITLAIMTAATALSGCSKSEPETQSQTIKEDLQEDSQIELPVNTETEQPVYTDDTELAVEVKGSIFEELTGQTFYFSSGAGGWATELRINADGTFEGHYYDSDMGDTGDGYPNGIQYDCQFKGQFSTPEQDSNYSYVMSVESIETKNETGTEEIIDGIKYVYTEPAGINVDDKLYIYLPGTPVSLLPEDYTIWAMMALGDSDEQTFYGIYNETYGAGFVPGTW